MNQAQYFSMSAEERARYDAQVQRYYAGMVNVVGRYNQPAHLSDIDRLEKRIAELERRLEQVGRS